MPIFVAEAYDKDNVLKTFELEQSSQQAALDFLKRRGLTPLSVKEKRQSVKLPSWAAGKVKPADKLILSKHLAVMIKVGVPLLEAVDLLNQTTTSKKLKALYGEMISFLEQGKPLSNAFKKHPEIFDAVYLGTVRVGEASGTLERSFEILTKGLEKQMSLNRKIKAALTYPAILLVAIIALVFLIITFVVPKLAVVFASANFKLPFLTNVMFSLAKFFGQNILISLILVVGIPIGLFFAAISRPGKRVLLAFFSRVPKFSDLIEKVQLARLSRSLHTMLTAGMSILEALKITSDTMAGTPYQGIMSDVSQDIARGTSLANAVKKRKKYFPGVFYGIITVGEKTGTIDEVLSYLADFYEAEVDSSISVMTTLIEPILLVFIGLIILLLASSTLVPIYSLISNIS